MMFGKYRVVDKLGEGGMAEVFLARFETPGGISKTCVVKAIHEELVAEKEFLDAFYDEARIALSLNHGNLVQSFDFGDDNGALYLAMEWCDAGDLDDLMIALARRGERLSVEASCHIMRGLLTGLAYAHDARDAFDRSLELVHRDISPPNVLLTHAGEIKLADFGIARAAQRLVSTGFGVVKGKPAYLAPEQAAGQTATHQSDIFSAGIIFWEMIVGRRLFSGGDTRQIMENVVATEIPRPDGSRSDLPPRLNAIIMRALSKNPEDRFENASAFLGEIESFAADAKLAYGPSDFAKLLDATFERRRSNLATARMKTPALGLATGEFEAPIKSKARPKRNRIMALCAVAAILIAGAFFLGHSLMPEVNKQMAHKTSSRAFAPEDAARVIVQMGTLGALIVIEDRPIGFNPTEGFAPIGKKKKKPVRISMPGARTFTANKILKAGKVKTIKKAPLKTEIGALAPSQKQRYIGGLPLEVDERMILPAGLYRIVDDHGHVEYIRTP